MGKSSKKSRSKPPEPESSAGGDAPFSLFGRSAGLDPALSSLFSQSAGPVQAPIIKARSISNPQKQNSASELDVEDSAEDELSELSDAAASPEASEDELDSNDDDALVEDDKSDLPSLSSDGEESDEQPQRQRKRKAQDDNLEGHYLQKLADQEAKDAAVQRAAKRQKANGDAPTATNGQSLHKTDDDSDSDDLGPPPLHETLAPNKEDVELDKAARTVFLGNVSNEAILSKSARRALLSHLASHLPALQADGRKAHKVESLRFRSTAFAGKVPKKASFARKELMETTARSTNAYAVYTTRAGAREAARQLNGTVVLGRHLRVDEVAHPAQVDHRRCVFVGNLGFVDDESAIKAAEKDAGYKGIDAKAQKGDVEEGLWQQFGKAGAVESVRVVRDAKTRVGKGFAYVQFKDQNGVEAALLFDGKKYLPLLPRKLRVTRAKKPSTTAGALERRQDSAPSKRNHKGPTDGRARKLLGRAGAANSRSVSKQGETAGNGGPIRRPESFVFEGHRATNKQGNTGLKLGAKSRGKKAGKPTNRGAKRGAAWKAKGNAKGGSKQGKNS